MKLQELVDYIKLEVTGGVLQLELDDPAITNIINISLKEIQRYYDTTEMITIPYSHCIDLSELKCSSVSRVYRTANSVGMSTSDNAGGSMSDPLYAQMFGIIGGANLTYNLNNYVSDYSAYLTTRQMYNNMSTDLAFVEDRTNQKLYINVTSVPDYITIEYIPFLEKVEDVKADYWVDILMRLTVAHTKVLIGRVRSRYTLSNALWQNDGQQILSEGQTELENLRQVLRENSMLMYGID